jgi:hypothetical protein
VVGLIPLGALLYQQQLGMRGDGNVQRNSRSILDRMLRDQPVQSTFIIPNK